MKNKAIYFRGGEDRSNDTHIVACLSFTDLLNRLERFRLQILKYVRTPKHEHIHTRALMMHCKHKNTTCIVYREQLAEYLWCTQTHTMRFLLLLQWIVSIEINFNNDWFFLSERVVRIGLSLELNFASLAIKIVFLA